MFLWQILVPSEKMLTWMILFGAVQFVSQKKSWDGFHFEYNKMWVWYYYFVVSTKVGPNPKEHLSGQCLILPLKHDTGCWVLTFEMYVLYHCMVRQGQATLEVGIFLFVDYSSIYIFPKFVLKKSLSQSSSLFKLHCN